MKSPPSNARFGRIDEAERRRERGTVARVRQMGKVRGASPGPGARPGRVAGLVA